MTPQDEAAMLRLFLTGRDVPCPQCDYNLRDLTGTRCPECGEELALRLQLGEPRQAAPIAGLVLLSAGAGLNGLLLIYLAAELILYDRGGGGWYRFAVLNGIGFAALGLCTVVWLKLWRKVRRLDAMQRWLAVAACGLATAVDLVCFIKFIR